MPILPLEAMLIGVDDWSAGIVRAAFTTRGAKGVGAKLRASKPFKRVMTFEQGCANYVWRMLCFDLLAFHPHCCLPVMADCDVYAGLKAAGLNRADLHDCTRDMCKVLDVLVTQVERILPPGAGIMRWGRALGMI